MEKQEMNTVEACQRGDHWVAVPSTVCISCGVDVGVVNPIGGATWERVLEVVKDLPPKQQQCLYMFLHDACGCGL